MDVDDTGFDVDAYPVCYMQGASGLNNASAVTEDWNITKLNTVLRTPRQDTSERHRIFWQNLGIDEMDSVPFSSQ